MNIVTNDILQLPVTVSEMADWAKLDSDDPGITPALYAATSAAISFLSLDLMQRTYTLTYELWPTVGAIKTPSLYKQIAGYKTLIDLPYANLIDVTSVNVNGEAYADYRVIKGKPDALRFDSVAFTDGDNDALEIVYEAGYGPTSASVPEPIRVAIMMAASYMYNHNGMCDAGDMLTMSGAKQLLTPFAVNGGIAL